MDTPSFKEDHISQIPALQLLQKLGYTYLSADKTWRCNKTARPGAYPDASGLETPSSNYGKMSITKIDYLCE